MTLRGSEFSAEARLLDVAVPAERRGAFDSQLTPVDGWMDALREQLRHV